MISILTGFDPAQLGMWVTFALVTVALVLYMLG